MAGAGGRLQLDRVVEAADQAGIDVRAARRRPWRHRTTTTTGPGRLPGGRGQPAGRTDSAAAGRAPRSAAVGRRVTARRRLPVRRQPGADRGSWLAGGSTPPAVASHAPGTAAAGMWNVMEFPTGSAVAGWPIAPDIHGRWRSAPTWSTRSVARYWPRGYSADRTTADQRLARDAPLAGGTGSAGYRRLRAALA